MASSFLVYALVHPITAAVHYIGKSSNGLQRPNAHRGAKSLTRDKTPKGAWIRSLLAAGMDYSIIVLEVLDSESRLNEAEIRWISYGRTQKWPLANVSPGGESGSFNKGRPRPDLAAWHKTAAGKAHASRLLTLSQGRKRPDLIKRNQSSQQRAAVSSKLLGRKFSTATIGRMSEGQRRRRDRLCIGIRINLLPP